jgi:hypothetical protein
VTHPAVATAVPTCTTFNLPLSCSRSPQLTRRTRGPPALQPSKLPTLPSDTESVMASPRPGPQAPGSRTPKRALAILLPHPSSGGPSPGGVHLDVLAPGGAGSTPWHHRHPTRAGGPSQGQEHGTVGVAQRPQWVPLPHAGCPWLGSRTALGEGQARSTTSASRRQPQLLPRALGLRCSTRCGGTG